MSSNSSRPLRLLLAAALGIFALTYGLYSQQPPAEGKKSGAKKGGGRGPAIGPVAESGFERIFDGRSLKGWSGDPGFWRVENGAIVGQTLADRQPKQNTFLVWQGGKPGNFELKLDYKLTGFNSGIQLRSETLPDFPQGMRGYQADIDGEQRYTGQFYEERGRGFLALRGQFTWIGADGKPGLVSSLGDGEQLKALIKGDDWNAMHIIARGNTLTQILNGRVMSMLIDDDASGRRMEGLIGIQCHVGPPMKIEVKNIRLKKL
jgi:hypothetical protein